MPSNYENVKTITRLAGEDLSDGQYRFVKLDSDGDVVKSGNGERTIGATMTKNSEGRAVTVGIDGRVLVIAGAAVVPGPCQSDANGAVINQTGAGCVAGQVFEAGASGTLVSVLLQPQGAP